MTMKTVDEPHSNLVPSTDEAPVAGGSLEDDGLHLVARLEQLLSKLEEAKQAGRTSAQLGRAKEMMVELLDFAEARFDETSLEPTLQQTREVYQSVKQFEQHAGSQSLGGIGRLFGVEHAHKGEIEDEAYRQLGAALVGLYQQYFELIASRFDDEIAAHRWQICSAALADDFQRKW